MSDAVPSSAAAVTPSWSRDDTERWLTDFPLPADFAWRAQRVWPRYQLKKGYGFWLRTTPYHQGMFELIHEVMAGIPVGAEMPGPDDLAARLRVIESEQGLLPFATPEPEPTENPPETHQEPNPSIGLTQRETDPNLDAPHS